MDKAIIISILDNDLYKFNMGQLVLHDFPTAVVGYEFINRGKTEFPPGFAEALKKQIDFLSILGLTFDEANFLSKIPGIRQTYVDWLRTYRYDPHEVAVYQTGGELEVIISGFWHRTIYWEVPLMAIISELYFEMTGKQIDTESFGRLRKKTDRMAEHDCHYIDYGTRRRRSREFHADVVGLSKSYKGFLGTSNVWLAMKMGIKAFGTAAHEIIMALSALYGPKMANRMYLKHWSEHFNGLNGIALTDTFTTDVFLRDFDSYYARLYDGVRQDSGDPFVVARKMQAHYESLNIDSRTKKFVPSNGLDDTAMILITNHWKDHFIVIGGIGTFLTNDCGSKPLNIVIKMRWADFGHGLIDVVKLSDDPGKHSGRPEMVKHVKNELGLHPPDFRQTAPPGQSIVIP